MAYYFCFAIPRQQESQHVAMATVKRELEETQKRCGEEMEQLVQVEREGLVKQRLQQDLGGLSETVVCKGGGFVGLV